MYLTYYFIFLWIKREQTIAHFLQLFSNKCHMSEVRSEMLEIEGSEKSRALVLEMSV